MSDETDDLPELLSPREAYEIASQWGSYMTSGDPGAVFYSFRTNDAQPQGERHRAQLLAYTESLLARETLEDDDRDDLESLKDFFTRFPHSGEEFRETYADESALIVRGFDLFTKGYVAASCWIGAELPEGHPDADSDKLQDFAADDIAPATLRDIVAECKAFQEANADLLAEAYARDGYGGGDYTAEEQAGHDFYLTRNGHGAGFWDREPLNEDGLGDKLSEAAKACGEDSLYQGDDGGIYEM